METTKDKKDFDNFVVGSKKKREKTTIQQQRKNILEILLENVLEWWRKEREKERERVKYNTLDRLTSKAKEVIYCFLEVLWFFLLTWWDVELGDKRR